MTASVLIIGERATGGLCCSISRAFRSLGWQVEFVAWGPWPSSLLASASFRVSFLAGGLLARLRRRVSALSATRSFDLVLVVKGPFLDPRTIGRLRRKTSAPVVCWNPDSPFDPAISNHGGGIPAAIGAYDAYVTWAEDIAERLQSVTEHVAVIPFGWDPELHHPVPGRGVATGRVVFIGTATAERVAILASLTRLRPLVFGNGWPPIPGVECRPPVVGREMAAIVGEASWNLNLLRPQNARSHNMRSFEVPASGGNQASLRTGDHVRFLGKDPRTHLYASHAELEAILGSDPNELAPRPDRLLQGHTYVNRVRLLLDQLGLVPG